MRYSVGRAQVAKHPNSAFTMSNDHDDYGDDGSMVSYGRTTPHDGTSCMPTDSTTAMDQERTTLAQKETRTVARLRGAQRYMSWTWEKPLNQWTTRRRPFAPSSRTWDHADPRFQETPLGCRV
jgi:hypothetical protein